MAESERRYTISQLLSIAEERSLIARALKVTGKCGAAERYYEWSNAVFGLRFLRDHGISEMANEKEEEEREVPA